MDLLLSFFHCPLKKLKTNNYDNINKIDCLMFYRVEGTLYHDHNFPSLIVFNTDFASQYSMTLKLTFTNNQ